jgi:hypothetical protein
MRNAPSTKKCLRQNHIGLHHKKPILRSPKKVEASASARLYLFREV